MTHPIVEDELGLLERVATLLEEEPVVSPPSEAEIVAELVRLRDEIPHAKEEDQGSLMDQYHQHVSLLEQIRAARQAPQVDPDCPYFAHLRLSEDGRVRDLCLGKATRIQRGIRIIDWRNAPISKVFYRYQQGEEYEEEIGGKNVVGEVLARRTVAIRSGKLDRIDCPEGTFLHEADGWQHKDREPPRLKGGEGAAMRAHGQGEGIARRLGTDLEGYRRRLDKRLPDIAGLIDPEQFQLITRPNSGFVVIRGAAGSGKTTVALHRIAWLAFGDAEVDSPRTLFVVFSPALRDYVSHVLPALGVTRAQVRTYRDWALEMRRRHFPTLPKEVRDDTPALVARLKLHPIVLVALFEQVRTTRAPSTVEQAIDDWTSALTRPDLLRAIRDEHFPGSFTDADLDRATTWCRDRIGELNHWLEQKELPRESGDDRVEEVLRPELDVEDDALLLRAWQLRIGPLRGKGTGPVRYRHVAIDEVQDLSPTEVRVLVDCLDERRSITLAGDTQQHVMKEAGFTDWNAFFHALGLSDAVAVDTLRISYRCSAEIMTFALALLGDLREDDTPPIATRSGPAVELFTFTDHGACVAFLAEVLDELLHDEPYASVALLTSGSDVSQTYYAGLARADVPRLRLVENQAFTFQPGVEITEIDQVKGLEFDYVVLLDASAARYPATPAARRLLHVGATRAVHQLWVTSVGAPSAIVREACE